MTVFSWVGLFFSGLVGSLLAFTAAAISLRRLIAWIAGREGAKIRREIAFSLKNESRWYAEDAATTRLLDALGDELLRYDLIGPQEKTREKWRAWRKGSTSV